LLMKDQYPLVAPFVNYNSTLNKYILEVEVNDVRVINHLFEKE
jgi:hypothetical protein